MKPKASSGGSLKCWNKAEDRPLRNGKMNNVNEDINMLQRFGAIREHDDQTVITLCSETTPIRRLLDDVVDTTACDCLP